jgi:hypothetical protein
MKNSVFTIILALLLSAASFAQLTGPKNIPGDYPNIAAAIAALNTSGVGAGGVTFNVIAGHTETFATPTAGQITTLTGSEANPIIFQKSGEGSNPVITAATGNSLVDAIIAIGGCDYVTFDGINLTDASANNTQTKQMEWGYALLKASGTNGSQNITIRNCTINLTTANSQSKGIYSNNHTPSSITQLTVTNATGANSNLKIYSNTISNCYMGIYLSGYNHTAYPYFYYDQNNEIGKDGANLITHIGGGNFVAHGIYTIYQNNLKVANNTINSSTATTGDPDPAIYGIYLTTAKNASYDLYGNTVTMTYRPEDEWGASAFYAIWSDMGADGINNTSNIYNNTVTNCLYPNSAGQAASRLMFLQNMGVTANVYGNIISNNTIGSAFADAAGEIRYVWIQKASTEPGPLVVHNNSVTGNKRIQAAPLTLGNTYFIAIAGSGTTLDAYDNMVDNNIVSAYGSTHCLYVTFNDSQSKRVYNNTITNISETNGSVSGLYGGYYGTMGYFYNNKIQNIKSNNTSSYSNINGIYVAGLGNALYFYNNMVADLSNPAANATEGYSWNMLNGIYVEGTISPRGFYDNTIYLNCTTTGTQTNYGSSAICAQSLNGVDLRNNILVNTSTNRGPNGRTVAIRARNAGTTGFTSDFNNLYTGTPGATRLIFYDGTSSAQTLSAYQTLLSPYEYHSVTEMPPFVNVATVPNDVHLKTDVATQCEAGGIPVNAPFPITTDFDGDARYPNAGYPVNPAFTPKAPDIGADEFGGLPNDLTPPAIAFTPLGNPFTGLARTLTTTITDGSGVPITGTGLPMLYWKKNSGAYQGVQATYVSGNTYTFTFGAGTVLGDVVSYYVVAQDLATSPNIGANPFKGAAGFAANPPGCTTPPSTPHSYTIVAGISGEIHVGIGKTYTTLTAAANDINSKWIKGQLTLILDDETYPNETFPIVFKPNGGSSAANNLIIKPNSGVTPVISGEMTSSAILKFKGIDYVTINGSNSGGTDRSLTFENISSSQNPFVIGITNDGISDPSTNITIKNCIISGDNYDIQMDTYLVVFNDNAGAYGGGYDNITLENNWLKRAKHGLQIDATATNQNHNILIKNNIFGSPDAADYITRWGIAFMQSDNVLITGNDIMGAALGSDAVAQFGITFYNYCQNVKITNNKIHDWVSNGPGAIGIKCNKENNDTPTEISNNVIYNIGAYGLNPGVALTHAQGITIRAGGNFKIWHNTIYLDGPYLYGGDTYAPSSACIALWNQSQSNSNTYDIRDNILRNAMRNDFPNPAPEALGKAYGIMMTDQVSGLNFDNNDFYIDGYQGHIAQVFSQLTPPYLINFPTLASWQAYSGQDMNSVTINPQFTSGTNLMPNSVALNNKGVYIPQVPTDITGATRSNPPDIGAYEFGAPLVTQNISLLAGWSGVSSYITPYNTNMNVVLSPILPQLSMLYNYSGIYYPAGGVYTLTNWNDHSGYAVKVSENVNLPVSGSLVTNKTVSLTQGWNLIPVLSSTPYSVVSLFSGVVGLDLVKDVAGSGVYWPAFGINSIGNVQPGKAYYVRMNAAGTINYGLPFKYSGSDEMSNSEPISTPWNDVVNTPASHLVAFNVLNNSLQVGDVIGGFTAGGWCAGVSKISDLSKPFALNLNNDDIYTSEMDGFESGNPLGYKLFRPSTGETFEIEVTYNPNLNIGLFENNGLSEVTALKMTTTGIAGTLQNTIKIFPNPSKGIFNIESFTDMINVRVFNALGDEVYRNEMVKLARIDFSSQPKGLYFVRIENGNEIIFEKLVIN